ncbi:hypothetical protein ACFYWY_14260 [Streptomyces sp. NPDC002870]
MERFRRASLTGLATAVVLAGSVGMAMAMAGPGTSRAAGRRHGQLGQ